ncbi:MULTISPECIES: nucleotide exchange factor GrpE [Bacillaceae]|uniref:nucleotide exchange factor GrpE n=1 Tax=Bacillaceae TaxID=186817 RepID=UPI002A0EFB82|nr:nucleotide exchange factor GrpE [Cytobacillus sp. IB215316]MDX8359533.1 nucleotide exchange factor GrpE [Cytobacillus sp. IB215316]
MNESENVDQVEENKVDLQNNDNQSDENPEETSEESSVNPRINDLEKKLDEAENRTFRIQADFDNFRRRTRLDREAAEKYRAFNLVSDILPVLDNFERALQVEADDDKTKSILQGMEMVYRQLFDALQKEGVEVIEAAGESFDPHLHQAVMQVEDAEHDPNTVVEELQKGYKLKDRVVRPSMVKVNG